MRSLSILIASILYRRIIRLKWFILAGILIALIFSGLIIERFNELGTKTDYGISRNTLEGRIESWKKIISLVPEHPFIGFGIGMLVYAIFVSYLMDEGITTKTLISLVLCFILISVQMFWKN